ncbi:hypothetical protein PV729_17120 [Streptomyces europaeiscabiei]|uniref:Uncharacterized protein n=1 Tax=Streptomyces europaeiscabiei TaxID=146819 RepID=A0ABU4NHQ5_9ACTN|nr:hypothetical protein [Streptomyces europaeiscabiei]MDX3543694.1 hypothetical protein [Streptomyces europaeiscabiei]MDX3553469.1 hypothetical protein [Streptomyces europaeiscabiei]MDX3701627.1 hypothetical protein [Streptomyces europaeiscabiei]
MPLQRERQPIQIPTQPLREVSDRPEPFTAHLMEGLRGERARRRIAQDDPALAEVAAVRFDRDPVTPVPGEPFSCGLPGEPVQLAVQADGVVQVDDDWVLLPDDVDVFFLVGALARMVVDPSPRFAGEAGVEGVDDVGVLQLSEDCEGDLLGADGQGLTWMVAVVTVAFCGMSRFWVTRSLGRFGTPSRRTASAPGRD